ncbi:nucleotidyltransferase domain-containing protein [bacterium]|nr:nucleotidyltransferase domain-containing protein [bacterium]
MEQVMQEKVASAVERWKGFWGNSLNGVYLYGSAARGNWNPKSSDINLLLLLDEKGYDRWPGAADIANRRLKKGFALPLLLTENYIRSSVDVFPMEFLDIKLFHETLFGEDLFPSLDIKPDDLRVQAEREVKGKWVQLRQAALDRGGNTAAMRDLLALSVPTWVSVFQSMLVVSGAEVPRDKRETLRAGAAIAGVNADLFLQLEEVRRTRRSVNRTQAWDLLLRSLEEVDQLARFVDSWNVA